LRIRIDRLHLIFARDSATLVDDVDRDLRTDRTGDRAPAAATLLSSWMISLWIVFDRPRRSRQQAR
jgi:hypothetical protein